MDEDDNDVPSLHDLLHETALDRHLLPPDLTSRLSSDYVDHLLSQTLGTLSKEPSLISAEASTVESELTNLCYREYGTFLSVHQCSSAVKTAFDDFQHSLDHLLSSVPALEDECHNFTQRARSLSKARNRSLLLQDHREKLQDLLEIPQLMETCARNGYYQEAMELALHAKDLATRYPNSRLVTDVAKEVGNVTQLVVTQLLNLLREPVKLAAAVKTVTFLRRLDILDESSLSLTFLCGRLHNFRNQLLQIEKDRTDPIRYLRKYIDSFREHVYDILSQYIAVFDNYDILVSFAGQCVTDMMLLIEKYVPRVSPDPASLSSILVQLGYCSLSFARIGLDFSQLIASPFLRTVQTAYSHALTQATAKLSSTLREAGAGRGNPLDSLIDVDRRSSIFSESRQLEQDLSSSVSLFPPLTIFMNDHLSAFNSLRLLAPIEISGDLDDILTASLALVSKDVLQFVSIANGDEQKGSRPVKHQRTPSSPRAHLFRRNTETQLSPGVRFAKQRETQLISKALCAVWVQVVHHLRNLLSEIFGRRCQDNADLNDAIDRIIRWTTAIIEDASLSESSPNLPSAQTQATLPGPDGRKALSPDVEGQKSLSSAPPFVEAAAITLNSEQTEQATRLNSGGDSGLQDQLGTPSDPVQTDGGSDEMRPKTPQKASPDIPTSDIPQKESSRSSSGSSSAVLISHEGLASDSAEHKDFVASNGILHSVSPSGGMASHDVFGDPQLNDRDGLDQEDNAQQKDLRSEGHPEARPIADLSGGSAAVEMMFAPLPTVENGMLTDDAGRIEAPIMVTAEELDRVDTVTKSSASIAEACEPPEEVQVASRADEVPLHTSTPELERHETVLSTGKLSPPESVGGDVQQEERDPSLPEVDIERANPGPSQASKKKKKKKKKN